MSDATLALLETIIQYLATTGTYVWFLFMDFSSAFNKVQPHLHVKRLLDLNVNTSLVLWIRSFLRDRPDGCTPLTPPTQIKGQQVQWDARFKYLGTVMEDYLLVKDKQGWQLLVHHSYHYLTSSSQKEYNITALGRRYRVPRARKSVCQLCGVMIIL